MAHDDRAATRGALVLEAIGFRTGSRVVLDGVSLEVPRGGAAVVCGDNGSGKSVLLQVAAGLLRPTSGRAWIAGYDLARYDGPALYRLGLRCGFVFEQGGLLSNLSVLANLTMPLAYHRRRLGLTVEAIQERARQCLAEAAVDPAYLDSLPAHVSRGIRRRVLLARVMALEPDFLFFDDPDAGLERDQASLVDELVLRMLSRPGATSLLTTTNPDLARRAAGVLYRLADGRLHAAEAPRGDPRAEARP